MPGRENYSLLNYSIENERLLIFEEMQLQDKYPKYKALLKFRNIPFEADLFTWNNDDL